jgi:hypothetical protein
MQMLYNSDSFIVVQFDVPSDLGPDAADVPRPGRGGYEIVDKLGRARRSSSKG